MDGAKRFGWVRAWAWAYAGLWGLTFAVGLVVWATPGGPGLARGVLGLALAGASNPARGVGAVVTIAVNNAFRAGWPLALGAFGVKRGRFWRMIGDFSVGANAVVCAGMVGAAVAGYGWRVVAFLPQLPLEWAGLAVGIAGWLVERRGPVRVSERLAAVGILVAFLAVAAGVEVWCTPHG